MQGVRRASSFDLRRRFCLHRPLFHAEASGASIPPCPVHCTLLRPCHGTQGPVIMSSFVSSSQAVHRCGGEQIRFFRASSVCPAVEFCHHLQNVAEQARRLGSPYFHRLCCGPWRMLRQIQHRRFAARKPTLGLGPRAWHTSSCRLAMIQVASCRGPDSLPHLAQPKRGPYPGAGHACVPCLAWQACSIRRGGFLVRVMRAAIVSPHVGVCHVDCRQHRWRMAAASLMGPRPDTLEVTWRGVRRCRLVLGLVGFRQLVSGVWVGGGP